MKYFVKFIGKGIAAVCLGIFASLRWYYTWLVSSFFGLSNHLKLWFAAPAGIAALFPVFVFGLLLAYPFHPDFGTFSDGYRMGTITDFGPVGYWITTYEGEMHLGYNSQPWNDPDDPSTPENPWKFSAYGSSYRAYQTLPPRKHVVAHYHQPLFRLNFLDGNTDYRVLETVPVDPKLAPEQCGDVVQHRGMLDIRSGMPTGYLVKDSEKGVLTKSWEIQIQKGDGGGTPMNLSITDPKIKACADLFIKSGLLAQFNYDTTLVRNPTQQDTSHTVVGIRRVEDDTPQHN